MKISITSLCAAALLALGANSAQAGPNPSFPFYGWGSIVATPSSPIVGEEAHIAVYVTNSGDAPATNVKVKLSFNDWGITFWGWQEIGEITVASIAANGGVATVDFYHTFETRTHTCLEVLITAADADDFPEDNRGQINLEVVNAGGDVFTYDVPIVNHGDEPIQVAVQPRCGGDAAGGQVPGECHVEIPRENQFVVLDPGEEILVPVKVDLRGVPEGGQVIVIVDAFNVAPLPGNDPGAHNHVQFIVRRVSASALKAETRELLNGLAAASTGGTRGKLQSAVRNLDNALKPSNWAGPNRLTKGGASVFAQELSAVNTLLGLLDTDLPVGLKEQINNAVNNLTDADRTLASTVGGDLSAGDAARAAGDNAGAINAYKHAWQAAQ